MASVYVLAVVAIAGAASPCALPPNTSYAQSFQAQMNISNAGSQSLALVSPRVSHHVMDLILSSAVFRCGWLLRLFPPHHSCCHHAHRDACIVMCGTAITCVSVMNINCANVHLSIPTQFADVGDSFAHTVMHAELVQRLYWRYDVLRRID